MRGEGGGAGALAWVGERGRAAARGEAELGRSSGAGYVTASYTTLGLELRRGPVECMHAWVVCVSNGGRQMQLRVVLEAPAMTSERGRVERLRAYVGQHRRCRDVSIVCDASFL